MPEEAKIVASLSGEERQFHTPDGGPDVTSDTPLRWRREWKFLVAILGILALAATAFAAYKLGQNQIPPPTSTPTPTLIPSATADWETFIYEGGFSIKHPPDSQIDHLRRGSGLYKFIFADGTGMVIDGPLIVNKELYPDLHVENIADWVDYYTRDFEGKKGMVVIGDYKGLNFTTEDPDALLYFFITPTESNKAEIIFISKDLKEFFQISYFASPDIFEEGKANFNLILSTFRFLEEEELTDIIGKILASPQDYLDKEVEIVGYFRGWDLLGEVGSGPPVTRSDWVIKDVSGAIYVEVRGSGSIIASLDPSSKENIKEIVSLKGIVKINPKGSPYIQPIDVVQN